MSYNGAGAFNLIAGNPVVTGAVISSTWANNTLTDIATGLSTAICKDGQTTITANLPMAGFKFTGLGAGTTSGDSVRYEQLGTLQSGIQGQTYTYFTTGGTSTAYTLTPTPATTANTAGQRFRVIFNAAAGATPTLAVSSQTAKNLKYYDTSAAKQAITSTQVPINWVSDVEYDGTDWVVLNIPASGSGGAQTLTDAATVSWNASLGAVATLVPTANRTMAAPSGLVAGGSYTLIITQDGTGSRTITWNAVYKGLNGAAMPQPFATASGTTAYYFVSPDGTNLQLEGAPPIATQITNSLGADVLLNNTANYIDGPSVAQGTVGTWFVSGTVTVVDTSSNVDMKVKLWDGTTVIASATSSPRVATATLAISVSGYITSPVGNLRISVRDDTSTNGKILFNQSGNSKDSTITAFRIA